jgi:hypothetical protein
MTLTAKRLEVMAQELAARSDRDVTAAIKRYDPEDKIALKHAIQMQREAQGISLDGAAEVPGRRIGEMDGSYWLRHLGVHGPIDLKTLEAKMAAASLEPGLRIEIKCEAIERGWLSKMLGYRLAAQGELQTDQDGRPLGRMATDEATVNHGPEPLSLEMAGLYRRAGLQEDGSYAQHEVDQAFANSDLTTLQKMAVRHSLAMRRQVRASGLSTLDERLAALRALPRQRPSMEGKAGHTMRANADDHARVKLLVDRHGRPRVLRSYPE